jgi:hypothetical protein
MESIAKRMNFETPDQMLTYLLRCYKEDPNVSDFAEAWRIQFEYALRTYDEVNVVFPTGIKWDAEAIPMIEWTIAMRDAVLGMVPAELNPEEERFVPNVWDNLSGDELEKVSERIDYERDAAMLGGEKCKD